MIHSRPPLSSSLLLLFAALSFLQIDLLAGKYLLVKIDDANMAAMGSSLRTGLTSTGDLKPGLAPAGTRVKSNDGNKAKNTPPEKDRKRKEKKKKRKTKGHSKFQLAAMNS